MKTCTEIRKNTRKIAHFWGKKHVSKTFNYQKTGNVGSVLNAELGNGLGNPQLCSGQSCRKVLLRDLATVCSLLMSSDDRA